MIKPKAITGGCFCGEMRYEIVGTPVRMLTCHCRDCQRITGTAMAAVAIFNKTDCLIDGEFSSFDYQNDSGHGLTRMFCPNCSAPVFTALDHYALGRSQDPSAPWGSS